MNCIITKAADSDLPLMQRFFYETVTNFGREVFTPTEIKIYSKLATNRTYWLEKFKTCHIYNAKLNGEVIGSICMDDDGNIDYIFVHLKYQNLGIAKLLYNSVEKICREKNINIITTDINMISRSFFEKRGFAINRNAVKEVGGGEVIELTGVKYLRS